MKKITFTFFTFFVAVFLIAQNAPPQAFNYSGVARNPNNTPIATQNIGVQFSVVKTNATTGPVVYSENHFTATDAFGLFNLAIGTGAVQTGNFAAIDWSNDSYFLRVGIDPVGGTNFATIGATQFLSVPYALYAKSAGSVAGGGSNNGFAIKLNGKNLSDSTLNLVFTGLYGHMFLTSTNYWFYLDKGMNYDLNESNIFTTDTISNSVLYIRGSNISVDEGRIVTPNTQYLPNASGLYYVPLTPTLTTVSNLYVYASSVGYYVSQGTQQVIQVMPNNPAITKFNEPFPINLTIERQ